MDERNLLIEQQYDLPGLFEDILHRLEEQGIDLQNVTRADIAGVDEFHIRGAEVSKELIAGLQISKARILDVGCGLGGPCRMLADEFDCQVTGIDMSKEFIRTAQRLSELVGLNEKTTFVQGDALDLPFDNDSFDIVWTQHVQMNIENKEKFYSEINRVLKPNGLFIYYDIFKNNLQDVYYPVPWANDKSLSFLQTIENMDSILKDLGLSQSQVKDQTNQGIAFFTNLLEKIKISGPPKMGLNVLMGTSTKQKLINVLSSLQEKRIALQSGIYIKTN